MIIDDAETAFPDVANPNAAVTQPHVQFGLQNGMGTVSYHQVRYWFAP